MEYNIKLGNKDYVYKEDNEGIVINNKPCNASVKWIEKGKWALVEINQQTYRVRITHQENKSISMDVNGTLLNAALSDSLDMLLQDLGLDKMLQQSVDKIVSPMPGLVLNVLVSPGTEVKKGDPLLVLEAMKMENILKSPADAVVKEVLVEPRQAVEKNQVLVVFND